MRLPAWLAQHLAALRAVVVFTVLLGLAYPLVMVGVAQAMPDRADGSLIVRNGVVVGSRLIGQAFTDAAGNPVPTYFQSRPSAAGDGYDPTATAASNLGPEDVVDTAARMSLLTQVCARSKAVGDLEGVDGRRPYCTADGVGAVLAVFRRDGFTGPITRVVAVNGPAFLATYEGAPVEAGPADPTGGVITPIRGDAPDVPAVPADAVTASASGLDPHISPAYADLQVPRIARERDLSEQEVRTLVREHTNGRAIGFLGEPGVNVLELNIALDNRQ